MRKFVIWGVLILVLGVIIAVVYERSQSSDADAAQQVIEDVDIILE